MSDRDPEQQSADYVDVRLKPYDSMLLKAEAKALISEAYEQGWIDRGRKDFNDEICRHSDYAPDCIYFDCGDCKKALPGVECDITKCVCYTKKGGAK